jgi:hypothetical protein
VKEVHMPMFVAVRDLPGVTTDSLVGAGARVKSCVAGMQSEGTEVRWVRSFFLPASSRTHCYFEGPSREAIVELNQRAGIPFEEIFEVAEMTPSSV